MFFIPHCSSNDSNFKLLNKLTYTKFYNNPYFFLQGENIFNNKKLTSLSHTKSYKLFLWLNKDLTPSLRYEFNYLTLNLFKLYFTNSKVDIPKVLMGISSVERDVNKVIPFKFTNYLMSNGNFIKTLLQLNYSWNISLLKSNISLGYNNWHVLYLLLTDNNLLSNNFSVHKQDLNQFIIDFIRKSYSIFSLYIYKVNKNIYKNTRGKSGKFMFVWKYVPVYKRLLIVMSWLLKELRVIPQRKFHLRITSLIHNMSKQPLKTWPLRVKMFSYNYVYRNCRNTLASSYISTKV